MLAFGKWLWLDNNRLLGHAGQVNYDENGNLMQCCEDAATYESQFFVYDLRTEEMGEMPLPQEYRDQSVDVYKVLRTGEFQIAPHLGGEPKWYRVQDPRDMGTD